MGKVLVGNDKVEPELRAALVYFKAIRQGYELRLPAWWPALDSLSPEEQARCRRQLAEVFVWRAAAPRYTADGRMYQGPL